MHFSHLKLLAQKLQLIGTSEDLSRWVGRMGDASWIGGPID